MPAKAQETDTAAEPAEETEDTDQPVVLSADQVVYDEVLNIVVASGDVEIVQAERTLKADRVTYNQRTEVVTATGNVVLVEPDGEVVFADYAELEDDLAEGFVDNVSLLLLDNSRMIANSGIRRPDGSTEVERAVYSPCDLCEEDPRAAPIWQIRAVRVIHDSENKNVIYRDAFFDFFGFPVLYTPYFSHADPTVERRSGFLFPTFGSNSSVGPFLNSSYYWDISPEQDATARLGITRDSGFILGGEYRRRFENGSLVIDGSVNRSDRTEINDAGQSVTLTDRWRGHLFADARFDLNDHWRAGANIRRASDDTYLEVFDISEEDVLESRIYGEGFYGLSYASLEAFDFQDLRIDAIEQPRIAPWLNYNFVGQPGSFMGGHFFSNASVINLIRDGEITGFREFPTEGVDTKRLSLEAGWQTTKYSDIGFVTDFTTSVRGDLYWSDDLPSDDGSGDLRDNVFEGRLYPSAMVTTRYPMVRQYGTFQHLVEPIVGLVVAPELDEPDDIPNNDSVDFEFDEINLFSANPFPGIDRIDDGTRATYGIKTGLYGQDGGYGTFFFGQSYRFTESDNLPEGSGLDDEWSDFVGRLTIVPDAPVALDYRFRIDNESFEARRHELTASAGRPVFRASTTYTFIDGVPGTETPGDREEVQATVSSQFSDYWSATTGIRYDITESQARDIGFGLTYSDECFLFGVRFVRSYTSDRDREAGDSIYFTLSLKNIGDLPLSGSIF